MTQCWHSSDFDFGPTARSRILELGKGLFDQQLSHDLIVYNYYPRLALTAVGQELRKYLKGHGCSITRVQMFASNVDHTVDINPHVDVDHRPQGFYEIPTRFNVMLLGSSSDPYSWWTDWRFNDPRLTVQEFGSDQSRYKSLAVPGHDPEQRLAHLGPTTVTADSVLTPSAWVRTNCVHSVRVSAGPRLVLSVIIDRDLDSIFNKY